MQVYKYNEESGEIEELGSAIPERMITTTVFNETEDFNEVVGTAPLIYKDNDLKGVIRDIRQSLATWMEEGYVIVIRPIELVK